MPTTRRIGDIPTVIASPVGPVRAVLKLQQRLALNLRNFRDNVANVI
jgi:hypothetical protein